MTLTIKDFYKAPEDFVITIRPDGKTPLKITVTPLLSPEKYASLVEDIVDGMFIADVDDVVTYRPYFKELIVRTMILQYYTDLELSISDESTLSFVFSDYYVKITKAINPAQLEQVYIGVDAYAQARQADLLDKHRTELNKITDMIEAYMGGMDDLVKSFSGIDANKFAAFIEKVGGMSEQSIVDNIIQINRKKESFGTKANQSKKNSKK